tara:strand:- start:256 stop:462 length:207 start_codon:yes stop_codon:yes gene_type:complete
MLPNNTKFKNHTVSFWRSVVQVKQNDFVHIDPSYQPISPALKFANYDKIGFGNDEQSELAEFLHYLNA